VAVPVEVVIMLVAKQADLAVLVVEVVGLAVAALVMPVVFLPLKGIAATEPTQ
tara:strand:+ start:110 stop:268 length:159 start_codon:yes stop_codon:yes gene_type:complete